MLGDKVHHLAAGHAGGAGGDGKLGDQLGAGEGIFMGGFVGEDLEGQRVQRIARQHGGGFVKGLVDGRLAAAQIVIVHARQIVVDEAVDMDAFDGEGDAQGAFPVDIEQVAGGNHQQRPHALAAADGGVAHGVEQLRPAVGRYRQQPVETLVHRLADGIERGLQAVGFIDHVGPRTHAARPGAGSNGRVPTAAPASFCWMASMRALASASFNSQCAFNAWPSV